ncbi:NAC domain-containing protein 71-like [Rhodamnia argentea]|uniref:NAC domain-containing protein 71-like n=1 Tax=Rhodamnia argentea TaxID=178133 RepID=A0ABM3GXC8_9MYRT|nr:NAC domain-containing protein 71-like [Rhodamnia argentea]
MEDTIPEVMRPLLPPGFRFHPTDEELLILYLKPKILGQPDESYYNIIPEIDVCKFEPWELPNIVGHIFNSKELFLYCCVKRKYLNSKRPDRTTVAGYWKVTGKERRVMSEDTNEQIGIKKTLVFYTGRVPKGERTNWVMHEYHLNSKCSGNNHGKGEVTIWLSFDCTTRLMLPYVACRIKNKKDRKLKTGHAPTISPEGDSSSPYTCTSQVSDPPVNQEVDYPIFCNTPNNNNEVADNQEVLDAEPEMSRGELMDSISTFQALDDYLPHYDNTSTCQSQAGAEEEWLSFLNFSDNNNENEFDNGYMPSPNRNFGLGWGNV